MKIRYLAYILISVITFGVSMTSCDAEDTSSIRNIEGHWLYMETKIDVSVQDPILKKAVDEYINTNVNKDQISYEFKNDRTYYFHQNQADPVKGKFKMIDKGYYTLDDVRGETTMVREKDKIYIQHDIRSEIADYLNIDQSNIIEANVTEIYKRGLSPY